MKESPDFDVFQLDAPKQDFQEFTEKEYLSTEKAIKTQGKKIDNALYWKRRQKKIGVVLLMSSIVYGAIMLNFGDAYVQGGWNISVRLFWWGWGLLWNLII